MENKSAQLPSAKTMLWLVLSLILLNIFVSLVTFSIFGGISDSREYGGAIEKAQNYEELLKLSRDHASIHKGDFKSIQYLVVFIFALCFIEIAVLLKIRGWIWRVTR